MNDAAIKDHISNRHKASAWCRDNPPDKLLIKAIRLEKARPSGSRMPVIEVLVNAALRNRRQELIQLVTKP